MIRISEKENSVEKEAEDTISTEITEDKTTKKGGSTVSNKKVAGLILSCIGGVIYLFEGILLQVGWFSAVSPSLIIAGIITLVGTGIGAFNAKIGGVVILISIPLALIFSLFAIYAIAFIIFPIPFPHSVLVIIGGILCVVSYETNIKVKPRSRLTPP